MHWLVCNKYKTICIRRYTHMKQANITITTLNYPEENQTETVITVVQSLWEPEENQYEALESEFVNVSLDAVLKHLGLTMANVNVKYVK